MKRILTVLAATLLLTAAMAGTASASSYDSVAEELSAIGVFRGTAGGFELDRAPTRSEAAIMLVRLYGAEDEAKAAYEAGEISMPFTDVSETAAPSVAWLYSQGITNGTSATTFGASSPCSAKMYCAFLLRALGYEDGVDFLYADTLDFAMLHGLFNLSMLDAAPFLRDDLAAVTYQALGADLKDGSTYLLASLVESGAIDAEAARPITEKIEAYRALTAASQASSTGIDADYTMNMGMDIAVDGSDGTETIHYTVGSDGELESCTADFDLDLVLGLPVTETENAQITAKLQMDMQMDVNATGDDVRISYPSFSNFEDLTPVLSGGEL